VDFLENDILEVAVKTRANLTRGYERIIQAMFSTLDAIAKEIDSDLKNASDDKEHLNLHILNMGKFPFRVS
jgi:hypothetical protein